MSRPADHPSLRWHRVRADLHVTSNGRFEARRAAEGWWSLYDGEDRINAWPSLREARCAADSAYFARPTRGEAA